jgi:hypothetical protein
MGTPPTAIAQGAVWGLLRDKPTNGAGSGNDGWRSVPKSQWPEAWPASVYLSGE